MKNPIIPFLLIFSLGIGLIFFMSLYGIEQKEEIAKEAEGDTTEEAEADVADFDPEVAIGQCVSCHGGDLTGGMGGAAPGLVGTDLSKEELVDIIQNGVPGTAMPGDLVPAEHLDEMADYILSLE
ncbi:cytochrome c [Sporosarcina sp. Marseille-Q4063]|uniref:c-type cytochrome n=1 Tax=Sporosarcina sp. Marseille-Q4063 TaxID=2810514 RepID=UPI001BB0796F|nr:cytochrome c [Sporosarcina sp. Marseille-Q4063]QUW22230.1 cytochrome c [Sporosarcina sp. Marseille-Q4063]